VQNIKMVKNAALGCLTASLLLVSSLSFAQGASNFTPEWVKRSNEIAYKVLESGAQFAPEFSGQSGVEGYDEEIFDLGENLSARQIAVSEQNILMLTDLLAKEEDPRVAQDIEIMIKAERDDIESTRINYERVLPYGNIPGLVFAGFRGLLDKQVPYERQKAALVRLKKYTFEVTGLIKPFVGEVEQDLERAPIMIEGLQSVFEATELEGYEEDLALLKEQLTAYNAWVEETILPNTRESAALPRELYELQLKNYGVDDSPEALIKTGQVGFMNIRNEMMALAPLVAKQKGYDTNNYREVIRLLKKEQIHGDRAREPDFATGRTRPRAHGNRRRNCTSAVSTSRYSTTDRQYRRVS